MPEYIKKRKAADQKRKEDTKKVKVIVLANTSFIDVDELLIYAIATIE